MLKQQRQNIWIWNLVLEPALGRSQQPSKKVAQLRIIWSEFPILGDESESVEVKIGKDLESELSETYGASVTANPVQNNNSTPSLYIMIMCHRSFQNFTSIRVNQKHKVYQTTFGIFYDNIKNLTF